MNIPIYRYLPHLQYHCVLQKAFTEEECDSIIDIAEFQEFNQSNVGDEKYVSLNKNARDLNNAGIEPNQDIDWVHRKISDIVSRVNFDKFQVDLDCLDAIQYVKHDSVFEDSWNNDVIETPFNSDSYRKLSFQLCLTDPASYEGGELLLCPTGNSERIASVKLNRGDVLGMYSSVPHRLSPITSGERASLVTWALGPKFR